MTKIKLPVLLFLLAIVSGCASNDDSSAEKTTEAAANTPIPDQSSLPPEKRLRTGPKVAQPVEPAGPEMLAISFGRGMASGNGLSVNFMHNVNRYKNGEADGEFKHSAVGEAGVIDIEAEVTCAELDGKTGRGWMGGKVTRNDSTNPLYIGAVGSDVWYRILDLGATEQTALISMPIFKQKGVGSAAAFCKKKPWSDEGLLKLDEGALAIFP